MADKVCSVASKIDMQQKGERAGMRASLRKHIERPVAGRCETVPEAQGLRQSTFPDSLLIDLASTDLRNSPPPQLRRVNLNYSPSPPPMVPLPDTQGDAVLIQFMDNGRMTDVSRQAGKQVLASVAETDPLQRRVRNKGLKKILLKMRK